MLDLSHLNAAGFWDLARTTLAPLVATHSNAHAVCPVPRNLTDDQLHAIRDSGGVVGLSLFVCDLRPDGMNDPLTPLDDVLRHLDHLLGVLRPTGVAIGSDFDGAVIPAAIDDATGLPRLVAAMEDHGYGMDLLKTFVTQTGWTCYSVLGFLQARSLKPPQTMWPSILRRLPIMKEASSEHSNFVLATPVYIIQEVRNIARETIFMCAYRT